MMSIQSRRELHSRTWSRYRAAGRAQKSVILDEFVAATGFARKYAIRLLAQPSPAAAEKSTSPQRRRTYGPEVQDALTLAWKAANGICGKRLVPFLPELVGALERHGPLQLTPEIREQLLLLSAATADRMLRPARRADPERGRSTTKSGKLLKHQIPVRTFADWNESRPGFMEADLVAHCGTNVQGTFLNTFVLTDVATGWTECLPLLLRSQDEVLQALERARELLPFPLLGLDTDNGSEFLNAKLLEYCRREEITFTRGRPYRKNDQCFVEQKNGVLVRQMVGYDRYEGERAYRQLTELYRALRLYVNFFQPSMKLRQKERDGGHVTKRYDAAQTPYQRLESSGALVPPITARLADLALGLDPLGLLRQVEVLQDAFWRHAVAGAATSGEIVSAQGTEAAEALRSPAPATDTDAPTTGRRRYRHQGKPPVPHTWRTREDPFAAVWPALCQRLAQEPDLTAKELLAELQSRDGSTYIKGQLRTLQRRVKAWRVEHLITFNAGWLAEETSRPVTLVYPASTAVLIKPSLGAIPMSAADHGLPPAAAMGGSRCAATT